MRLLLLVLLVSAACDEPSGCGEEMYGPPGARAARSAPAASGPRSEAARAAEAGAPSPDALVASARKALSAGDHGALLASVWPETRDVWLADLIVDLAIESTERPGELDAKRRAARADVRAILARHGATIASRPEGLSPGGLAKELLARVPDRVALYADLLALAARERTPFDPSRALTGAAEPSISAVPLLRLVERLKSPGELERLDGGVVESPPEGAFAVFLVGEGGPVVLRMRAKGGAYWLDES